MGGLLVLQLKRIGDAVLTAPVLGAVRAACPDLRITLALAGAAAELGSLFPMVDEVLAWSPGKWNASLLTRVRELRAGAVLDFTGTDRSALLALVSGAPVRAGYGKFHHGWLRRLASNAVCGADVRILHTIDFHLELAETAGFPIQWKAGNGSADAGHLRLPPGLLPAGLPPGYVHLHPGTAREEKFWPPAQWAKLMGHLHHRHGLPLVLTGGDWEFERAQTSLILESATVPVIDLRGRLRLPQLAAVAAHARLAVTVDTAAMHLAAAFRVPQIGLFGPTNPWHWAPRHRLARVLRAGVPPEEPLRPKQPGQAMDQLSWQTVAAAADHLLGESAAAS